MPLRVLEPASERDLLWEWMRAEVDIDPASPRAAYRTQQAGLRRPLLDRLARNDREGLSDDDWTAIRRGFHGIRGDYLAPLYPGPTAWSYAELDMVNLAPVRVINATISFLPLAPSRRLEEFVASLDAGKETPRDDFSRAYRSMRGRFDPERYRGCPVLIAERPDGPYVLAEGLTRACVLLSRHLAGQSVPRSLRVLLGVNGAAMRWPWF